MDILFRRLPPQNPDPNIVRKANSGSERENDIFQIGAPRPILSSQIHLNSSQYDLYKIWLTQNDHFLTYGAAKVHVLCVSHY